MDAAFRMHNTKNPEDHDHIYFFLVRPSEELSASLSKKNKDQTERQMFLFYLQDDKVFSYYNHTLEEGYPKDIQEDFPGVPSHLDAAVECPTGECMADTVLFFKGVFAFRFIIIWQINLSV